MKFEVDAADLRKAIAAPAAVAPLHLRVAVADGHLHVTGDNTVVRVTQRRPVTGARDGHAYVGATLFHDLAKVMPTGPVTIEAVGPILDMSGGGNDDHEEPVRASMYTAVENAVRIPAEPPEPPPVGEVEMSAFNTAMAQVVPAALSHADDKPVLCSVQVRASRGALVFAASDQYRLHTTRSRIIDAGAWGHEALIPAEAVKLAGIVFDDDDDVRVALDRDLFTMRTERTTLVSRLVQDKFPSWQGLVPQEKDRSATVAFDTAALLDALARVAPIARLGDQQVTLTAVPEDRLVIVKSRAVDTGESSASFRAHNVTGASFTFPVHLRWITDAAKCSGCQRLTLYWVADRKPCLIQGFGTDYQAMVMPIRPDQKGQQ